jgi:hypothetical protein
MDFMRQPRFTFCKIHRYQNYIIVLVLVLIVEYLFPYKM